MTVQNIVYDKLDFHVKNVQYIGKNKVDRCLDQYKNPSNKKKIMYTKNKFGRPTLYIDNNKLFIYFIILSYHSKCYSKLIIIIIIIIIII
jgi:hypothetical protein